MPELTREESAMVAGIAAKYAPRPHRGKPLPLGVVKHEAEETERPVARHPWRASWGAK